MRIAMFLNTPAQFHFWRGVSEELRKKSHTSALLIRNYGETLSLIKESDLNFFLYSPFISSKTMKILTLIPDVMRAYKYLRSYNPDVVVGMGVYDAIVSGLLNKPCIEFTDSEPMVNPIWYNIQFNLSMPFVDVVLTPTFFRQCLGKKHLRIASYKELAYLHPNYYLPSDDFFDFLEISKDEDYVLLRFNAFDAVHDVGVQGFKNEDKIRLVKELEKYARVFISAEGKVPKKLKSYLLPVPKSRIHDVIYYAKLLVTDTQTMATEAAILGTPTVRCNKFVGPNDMGNFIELERKYGLIFNFRNPEEAIKKALDLVKMDGVKQEWLKRRKKLLGSTIDIASFMAWFIENFPASFEEMKENPEVQFRFR